MATETKAHPLTRTTKAAFIAEAQKRFGSDMLSWAFVCPICGYEAAAREWKQAGAPEGAVGFSCIGRYRKPSRDAFEGSGKGPCNYAGGGLFKLNPMIVTDETGVEHNVFALAGEQFPSLSPAS